MTACTHEMHQTKGKPTILLVGHPNVGKSVLFHRLTGTYVTVSNYPGTTVEIASAPLRNKTDIIVMDTPGVLALPSRSDDERATIRALLNENTHVLVQVGDAKNLRRTLSLTALLADFGLPMLLVLNMHDEAIARGVVVDVELLSASLGIPVVTTIATEHKGIDNLSDALNHARIPSSLLHYDEILENAVRQLSAAISPLLPAPAHVSARGMALLALGADQEVITALNRHPGFDARLFAEILDGAATGNKESLPVTLARERILAAERWVSLVFKRTAQSTPLLSQRIGQWIVHPWYSIPILLFILWIVYLWVGVLGATWLVELLEEDVFEAILNPFITQRIQQYSPYPWLTDLLVGPYGLWTMGMTYALALILPIVTTFFIAFGLLEDSGYFARLSVLANRGFTLMGLNGRAILPMILGLGCVTMATLTTRILHSNRERLITTLLLALAIPCSAQLGVVLGMLGRLPFSMTLIWVGTLIVVLLLSGFLASQLIPGRRIPLVTEMPPIRVPVIGNVVKKTTGRLRWYLVEVIPLFLLGTFVMFLLDKTGGLPAIIAAGEPLVTGWLGLPPQASAAFVMGFLRRDFGATGLFAMSDQLTPEQTIVGMVTLTLFIPCFASLMMIVKEQGLRIAIAMLLFIVPFAFLVGGLIHQAFLLYARLVP